jgi:hypothetical protein
MPRLASFLFASVLVAVPSCERTGLHTPPAGTGGMTVLGGVAATGGAPVAGGAAGGGGSTSASGDAVENNASTPGGTFTSVSVGPADEACGVRTDGTVACWGNSYYPAPAGTFISVSAGDSWACGIRTDRTITCWGGDAFGDTIPPAGAFTSVTTGYDYACGLRTDGTIACWGDNAQGDTAPPAGTFKFISLGRGYDCGVRTEGTIVCWGNNAADDNMTLPGGTFKSLGPGGGCPCGVRTDGTIACCKVPSGAPQVVCVTPLPSGPFASIIGDNYLLRTDGTIAESCASGIAPPSGTFISVSVGSTMACGVKTDGTIDCWGGAGPWGGLM